MHKLAIVLLVACMSTTALAKELAVGDMAYENAGRDEDHNKLLLSEHRGKVIVLTFWATWCAPCLEELPILENIQRQVSPDRLKVIAINFKQGKKAFRRIRHHLKDLELTLSYDRDNKIARRYAVEGIPYTLIIDKTGRVAHIHRGYGDGVEETLVNELNVLLASEYAPQGFQELEE